MNIKRKNISFILVQILVVMIGLTGITFAVSYIMNGINVDVNTANLAVDYTGTLSLPSTSLYPILDSEVATNTENVMRINFTVKGKNTNPDIPIIYDVVLTDLEDLDPAIRSEYVKWELIKNGMSIANGNLSYDFDTITDGRLVLTNIQQDLKKSSETADSYEFRLWISESCPTGIGCTVREDQSELLNKKIKGKIGINLYTKSKNQRLRISEPKTSEEVLEYLGLTSLLKEGTPNFSTIATTDEGIYASVDDLGTSYYFRGASSRNYVKFGKWNENTPDIYYGYYSSDNMDSRSYASEEECENATSYNYNCTLVSRAGKDMYWRIVRINGDGTIRMIYDGIEKHRNGEGTIAKIGNQLYNYSGDNAYFGYMYGSTNSTSYEETHKNVNNSLIKDEIDLWYSENISGTEYERYVADAIYCNDRKVISGYGVGTVTTDYGANRLFWVNSEPTLICEHKNDRFTKSNELGNGDLEYPIGLISADEAAMAGGKYNTTYQNTQYYLYTGESFWTMSPYMYNKNGTMMWYFDNNGYLYLNSSNNAYRGIRPIISLNSSTNFSGDGSYNTPFYIK